MTLWISCQMALSKNLFHKDGKKRAQHLRVFCVWRCDHQQEHDWLGATLWGSIVFGIAGKDGCIEGWALTGNDGQCSIGSGLNCSTWAVLLAKLTLKRKKSWLLHLLFHKFERVLIQNGGEDLNFCVRCFFLLIVSILWTWLLCSSRREKPLTNRNNTIKDRIINKNKSHFLVFQIWFLV